MSQGKITTVTHKSRVAFAEEAETIMALIRDGATPAKVARWLQRFGQDAYRLGYEGGYQQGHDAGVEHGYGSAHEEQRSREQLAAVLQHREADQISQGIVEHSADAVQLN